MKLCTLLENTTCRNDLCAEHGLSLYMETDKHKLLFDMGQSDAFAINAQKLQIDLMQVDTAILSHGHYDHGGGLAKFLSINQQAPVYLNHHGFGEHYHGSTRYIGLAPELAVSKRIRLTDDYYPIDEQLELYSCNDRLPVTPINAYGLTLHQNDSFLPDPFLHEQYLLIYEKCKKILISGCSHKGILNLMHWFQPDIFVGGFHFKDIDDSALLKQHAETLLQYPTQYYTGHCTGAVQYASLKDVMGHRLEALSTGKIMEI